MKFLPEILRTNQTCTQRKPQNLRNFIGCNSGCHSIYWFTSRLVISEYYRIKLWLLIVPNHRRVRWPLWVCDTIISGKFEFAEIHQRRDTRARADSLLLLFCVWFCSETVKIEIPAYGPDPIWLLCPSCRTTILTHVEPKVSSKTHLCAFLFCVFG